MEKQWRQRPVKRFVTVQEKIEMNRRDFNMENKGLILRHNVI